MRRVKAWRPWVREHGGQRATPPPASTPETPSRGTTTTRRATPGRRALTIALWATVGLFGTTYAASITAPLWFELNHQNLLIVTSGSMAGSGAGAFDAGAAVVMRTISDPSQLKVGQVVTFRPTGSDGLVSHRITSLHYLAETHVDGSTGQVVPTLDAATGEPVMRAYVVTKGDANSEPDPDATPASQVRGVVLRIYPGWGWVLERAHSPEGRFIMLAPPLAALAAMELLALAEARRTRSPRPGPDTSRPLTERAADDLVLD